MLFVVIIGIICAFSSIFLYRKAELYLKELDSFRMYRSDVYHDVRKEEVYEKFNQYENLSGLTILMSIIMFIFLITYMLLFVIS